MTGLRHQAFFYEGVDAFLSETLPFIQDGLDRGDPTLVVTTTSNLAAVRAGLGTDADRVVLHDAEDWYRSPGKAFSACFEFVATHSDAARIRAIGEVKWPVDWADGIDEYAHYESVFNVIAREAPVDVVCPYDIAALPDGVLDHARATHPEIRRIGRVEASREYRDPDEYCSHLAGRLQATPGGETIELTSNLADLRRAVAARARAANVPAHRIPDFLLAVHEIGANALTHGGGGAVARLWMDDRRFVCEIEDHGPGLSETTAGYVPPAPEGERGRGLWLARQICDLVEVFSRDGITRVRLSVRRG